MHKLIPLIVFSILVLPLVVSAAVPEFKPLIQIDFERSPGQSDFSIYINFLYKFAIALAAMLAVIKIVIAGVKYMLSDVVTNKSDAIKDIKGALIGILIILSAVVILNLINPKILKNEIKFDKIEEQPVRGANGSGGAGGGVATTKDGVTTTDLNGRPDVEKTTMAAVAKENCTDKYGTFSVNESAATCVEPQRVIKNSDLEYCREQAKKTSSGLTHIDKFWWFQEDVCLIQN